MNREELLIVLGTAASLDNRFGRKTSEEIQLQASAWLGVLSRDMPADFALAQVGKHYAKSTTVLMPADLEIPWRSFRDHERAKTAPRQLETNNESKGMPSHVRAKLVELGFLKP